MLNKSYPFLLFLCFLTGVIEAWLLFANLPFFDKAFFHLLIIALIGIIANLHKENAEKPFLILLTLSVLTMGPFGSLICFIGALIFPRPSFGKVYDDLFELVLPAISEEGSKTLSDRILYGFETHQSSTAPTSFNEIMSYGTFYQKRMVIEKILRFFSPSFTSILRKALKDRNAVIRTLAATAIVALDDRFFEKYHVLEEQANRMPHESNIFQFARYCEFYFYSNVTDLERKQRIGKKAIKAFEKYHEMEPEDSTIFLSLGKLYYYFKDKQKALHFFERFLEKFPKHREASLWYLRFLYEKKEYAKVRQQSLQKVWKTGLKNRPAISA